MTCLNHLEKRIGDQKQLIAGRLAGRIPNVRQYYWGASKIAAHGMSGRPDGSYSLIPQLLGTPHLIVDILPIPSREFVHRYGLTLHQMSELAERGHIIPNIYHYKGGAWKEYGKYPAVTKLLIQYGRPNNEWITSYLECKYHFSRSEQEHTQDLLDLRLTKRQQGRAIDATHGRLSTWQAFCSVYGQRLAYIDVLGGDTHKNTVLWIKRNIRNPALCKEAVKVLNASKRLIASETTAAFGGKLIHTPTDLLEIKEALPILTQLDPKTYSGFARLRRAEFESKPMVDARRYLQSVVDRIAKRVPAARESISAIGELDAPQFASYLRALEAVKDGRVGALVDRMTTSLLCSERGFELAFSEYLELERELNDSLKALAPVGSVLQQIGSFLLRVDDQTPDEALPEKIKLGIVSLGATFVLVGAALKNKEILPFWRLWGRRSVQLCGSWRAVKTALGLETIAAA